MWNKVVKAEAESDSCYNPMRYCGEYYDSETGLIYLRARYYDPSVGRFTTVDPIKDGTNWYLYCSGNPIAFVDPSGLDDYIICGPDQAEAGESYQEQLLTADPWTVVHLIIVSTADEFEAAWNSMGEDGSVIENVIINVHGNYRDLFPGTDGKTVDISRLQEKNADMVVLLSCDTGNLEYEENVAVRFTNKCEVVVAPDGTNTSHRQKNGDIWVYSNLKNSTLGINRYGLGYCLFKRDGEDVRISTSLTSDCQITPITSLIFLAELRMEKMVFN